MFNCEEEGGDVLAADEVGGEEVLRLVLALELGVAVRALVQHDVDDVVRLAQVFGRLWHDRVDDFVEEPDVAPDVVLDARYELRHGLLVLLPVSCEGIDGSWEKANLGNVFELDGQHLLLPVRDPLLYTV